MTPTWQPMETVPTDKTPILVWLEEPLLGCRVVAARFFKALDHHEAFGIVGGLFEYDAPKALYWMHAPEGPTGEGKTI